MKPAALPGSPRELALASCWLLGLLHLAGHAPQREAKGAELRTWLESGARESSVDVLFVGEGYTSKELGRAGKYWKDVDRCSKRLFQDLPFSAYKERFNVRALMVASGEPGCDQAAEEREVDTALDASFDTRDGRLLVFRDQERLKALVESAGPTDVVFVMVNTERYGGAGTVLETILVRGRPLPAPTYAAQDTRSFLIALHEPSRIWPTSTRTRTCTRASPCPGRETCPRPTSAWSGPSSVARGTG